VSFLVALALGIAGLAVAPLIAHLFRRGRVKEQPFPPAALVPTARSAARESRRLQDWLLFLVRAGLIVALALLGATPLVQCSRLQLSRAGGASVALALVVDDSLSMRARLDSGTTRFERARAGALELAKSARRGDALGVILAGRPARVLIPPTTDLDRVKKTLSEIKPTDRSTDVAGAVQLARSLLAELPQRDKQLAVLSDFAADPPTEGRPAVWAPLSDLGEPVLDCAVISAQRQSTHVEATIACNTAKAAEGRKLELLPGDPTVDEAPVGTAIGNAALAARGGVQTVTIALPKTGDALGVRLTGKDAIEHDDAGSVSRESVGFVVGVVSDPTRSSPSTGGRTLLEQALSALGEDVALRPLSVVPEDPAELSRLSALILDDPPGLGPEVREALAAWIARGKVAVAFLGRRVENVQLGSTLEPFAHGAVRWQPSRARGLNPSSLSWLGPEAAALNDLAPKGRPLLEGADLPGARVQGRWQDGAPFLFERDLERGLVLTLGLSASADDSDLPLRPAFLALLDHVLELARERSGPARSAPGTSWRFSTSQHPEIRGPGGALPAAENAQNDAERVFVPELAGRYLIKTVDGSHERAVSIEPQEISAEPRQNPAQSAVPGGRQANSGVDISAEVVWLALALVALELGLRAARLSSALRRRRDERVTAAAAE
jgi:Mg-chelatase subunit ChlD